MPVTINGTTGVVTPGATIGSINGILKSSSGVVSQASVGTDYSQLTLATAQTASGTSDDFTGIPSWVKRITVMLNGVSTNGASIVLVQLGTSSGITTSGYSAQGVTFNSNGTATGMEYTNGFPTEVNSGSVTSAGLRSGSLVFNNVIGNTWVGNGIIGASWLTGPTSSLVAGKIALAATLDRLRITTVNGTDTFDAGTINISYE